MDESKDWNDKEAVMFRFGLEISDRAREKMIELGPDAGTEYVANIIESHLAELLAGVIYSQTKEEQESEAFEDVAALAMQIAGPLTLAIIESKAIDSPRPFVRFETMGREILRTLVDRTQRDVDTKTQREWGEGFADWLKNQDKKGEK